MATLRLGGNRFFRSSWRRVLEPLSSHPPRELNLSFASVLLPRFASAAAASGGGGGGGAAESPTTTGRDDGVVSAASMAVDERAVESLPEISAESGDGSALSLSRGAPAQSLGELLAATVLPADAPGVETLNLAGSTGLLISDDCRQHHREVHGSETADTPAGVEEPLPLASSSSMEAFLLLLRDALASPLCRTTHLLFAGVRGSPPRPELTTSTAAQNAHSTAVSGGMRPSGVFLPRHAESLCEAVSTCASLRCLDLAGCALSGPVGAAAAAAAVACLIRNDGELEEEGEEEGASVGTQEVGFDAMTAVAGGLDRLSLRACGLGTSGLSAVVQALIASPENDRGSGRRRKGPLPRFPGLLDLSDNRPFTSSAAAAAAAGTAHGAGAAAGAEEADDAALTELAGSVRALEAEGLISVVVARDPRRLLGRCDWLPAAYFPTPLKQKQLTAR